MRLRLLLAAVLTLGLIIGSCGKVEQPRPAPTAAPVSPLEPRFDLNAVVDQVHFAFREAVSGPEPLGWIGGHTTYEAKVSLGGVSVQPFDGTRAGPAIEFHVQSIRRGDAELEAEARAGSRGPLGAVTIDRGGVEERFENRAEGLEQSWTLRRAPVGKGDLVVRVGVQGARYQGSTKGGLHFSASPGAVGVRYGHATWVDAGGNCSLVPAIWDEEAIA